MENNKEQPETPQTVKQRSDDGKEEGKEGTDGTLSELAYSSVELLMENDFSKTTGLEIDEARERIYCEFDNKIFDTLLDLTLGNTIGGESDRA